jgi:glycogen synthase
MPRGTLMTVLMTTDTVGGVWHYSLELARGLAPYGVRTVLATMGPPLSASQRKAASSIPGLQIQESRYRLEWMPDAETDIARAGEWLLSIERRFSPDVVHVNGFAHGSLAWKAPCLVVAHSCVLSWWLFVKGEPAPQKWDGYARFVGRGLAAADLCVFPTRSLHEVLSTLYGPFTTAAVIYNGRNHLDFQPLPKHPYVFSAGRIWDEAKNIVLLDRIASRVAWPIHVAGDCRGFREKEAPPKHLKYQGVLGQRQMALWMGRASIYALPARYEPFGLTVLEAALAGCALVLGDIPFLRELWGECALFVSPDSSTELTEALSRFINDPMLRKRMARAARLRAGELSTDRMAREYLSAYARLLKPGFGERHLLSTAVGS